MAVMAGIDGQTGAGEPEIMTVPEVAAYMRVSEKTVRIWLRAGRLRGLKAPGAPQHRWRIPRSELEKLGQRR